MYLSKIQIDMDNFSPGKAARLLRTSVYNEHQWIWNLFPENTNMQRDFLYRRIELGHTPQYFILSKREPVKNQELWQMQTKEFNPKIKTGNRFSFSLRVNPIITRRVGKGTNKRLKDDVFMNTLARYKDKPLSERPSNHEIMIESGLKWLLPRGENYGFSLDEKEILVEGYYRLEGLKNKGKHAIKLGVLDYSGILTVQNTEKFYEALYNGIGKAKGFGCGLLLIKRA